MSISIIGDDTIGPGNNTFASGVGQVLTATLTAHPSNGSVLYVRRSGSTTGYGYPLAAGATVTLDSPNLNDYTVSGASGQRIAYIARK